MQTNIAPTESKRTNVSFYFVCFKGVYGRNRSEKFTTARNPLEGLAGETAFVAAADAFLADIKAKRGTVFIRRHDGCEVSTYQDDRTGRDIITHTVPMTATRVYQRTV